MRSELSKYISNVNTANLESFQVLKNLKGKNIFDTFLNVESFNNLQEVKKEVKSLKIKFEKLPKGLSKGEKKEIRQMRRARNKELQAPFWQSINDAEKLQRKDRNVMTKKISQSIFEEQLNLKQKRGKAITYFDTLKLNNPKIRMATKFLKTKFYAATLINLLNYENIENANEELGLRGATEEVCKNTAMTFLGLSALKYTNTKLKNVITTLSLYIPAGRFLKGLSFPLSIGFSLAIKPILDSLWVTEYEKIKEKNT